MTTPLELKSLTQDLQSICGQTDAEQLWDAFLRAALTRTGADKGYLLLSYLGAPFAAAEAERNLQQVAVRIDRNGESTQAALPGALLERARREHRTIVLNNISVKNRFFADRAASEHRPQAALCMPLGLLHEPMGLLYLEHYSSARPFTPSRVALMELLAAHTSTVLERELVAHRRTEVLASERKLLSTLIDHLPDYIYVKDRNGRFIADNVAIADGIVMTPDDAAADPSCSLTHDEEAVVRYGHAVLDREESAINAATGTRYWHTHTKVALRDDAGRIIGLIGIKRDITERKQAEAALRESERRFRSLTELSSDWYWEQDVDYRFTYLSEPTRAKPDERFGQAIGKAFWELPETTPLSGPWADLQASLAERRSFRDFEFSWIDESKGMRYTSVSGMPIFDQEGRFCGYRGTGRDITERKLSDERIRYLATHDGLTGLPNRVMFAEILNLTIHTARRYERGFAVFFIDLDRFKIINDSLGHEAGDALLKEIATRLTHCLRASDVVARLGGDEFVVLLQEVNEPEQVSIVARKILSATLKPLLIQEQECRVTASIGIAMYPADGLDEQSLMKNADIAMYQAKEEGKNNFQFYAEDIRVQSLERLTLEAELRHALERHELLLHYQAKLDLTRGDISGVEALVRWQHPKLGLVSPAQFIPLAEETGLIIPLGRWVLRTACAQNVAWQRAGLPPVCMAVNLSPRQFSDDNLLADLDLILQETGMNPELLELEITESMVMGNIDRAAKQLTAIKQRGVRLAIDDFGTGYSSLAQIKRFPIDTLKVDRSFIRELQTDPEDRAITEAIIAMGKTLSLKVVAEGVETEEQQAFLRKQSCDEMQGFYFSKPVPAAQFAELLRDHVAEPENTSTASS